MRELVGCIVSRSQMNYEANRLEGIVGGSLQKLDALRKSIICTYILPFVSHFQSFVYPLHHPYNIRHIFHRCSNEVAPLAIESDVTTFYFNLFFHALSVAILSAKHPVFFHSSIRSPCSLLFSLFLVLCSSNVDFRIS